MTELYVYIIPWLILAGLVAALAVAWNRSGGKWLLVSLLLSPVVGFIALVVSGKRPDATEEERIVSGDGTFAWVVLGIIGLLALVGVYMVMIR